MSRHIPISCPTAPTPKSARTESREFTVHIVTPIFGGGVLPGQCDPVTLIRGPSIRGQLRFWWRATRGARFETPKQLWEEEERIWGSTKKPSKVIVELECAQISKTDVKPWACHGPDRKYGGVRSIPTPQEREFPQYALFPFQGETETNNITHVRAVKTQPESPLWKGTFTLRMSWSLRSTKGGATATDIYKDAEAAIWAWVNFGGLGARTRRGCGALYCPELAPAGKDVGAWYAGKLREYEIDVDAPAREWAVMPKSLLIKKPDGAWRYAWKPAVDMLRTFRQGVGVGRFPGRDPNRPGRSRWPEPESIRELAFPRSEAKERPLGMHPIQKEIPIPYFPRAEFGLPIIFEIRGENLKPTLEAQRSSRMASPLILKALAVTAERAYPLAMRLKTRPVAHAVLKKERGSRLPKDYPVQAARIRSPALAAYADSPMKGRSKSGSALEAFLKFALQNGFEEVGA